MKQMTKTNYGICGINCEFTLADLWVLKHTQNRLQNYLQQQEAGANPEPPIEEISKLETFLSRILFGAPEIEDSNIFDPVPEKEPIEIE